MLSLAGGGTQWRGAPLPDGIRLWFKHPCFPLSLYNLFRASFDLPLSTSSSFPDLLYRFQPCSCSVPLSPFHHSFCQRVTNTTGREGTPTFGKERIPLVAAPLEYFSFLFLFSCLFCSDWQFAGRQDGLWDNEDFTNAHAPNSEAKKAYETDKKTPPFFSLYVNHS